MSEKKSLLIILTSAILSILIFASTCTYFIYYNYEKDRFDEEYSDIKDINIDTNSMNVSLSNYKMVKLLGEHRIPECIDIYKDSKDNKVDYKQLAEDLTTYKVKIKTNANGDVLYTTVSGDPSFTELSLYVRIEDNKLKIETNTGFNDWLYIDPNNDYRASGLNDSSTDLKIHFTDGVGELEINDPEQLNLIKVCQVKIESRVREFFSYASLKINQDSSVNSVED